MKNRALRLDSYCLPNHQWNLEHYLKDGKSTDDNVVRRTKGQILLRIRTWNQQMQLRDIPLDFAKGLRVENSLDDDSDSRRLHGEIVRIVDILKKRADRGNAEAAQRLEIIARDAVVTCDRLRDARPELIRPLTELSAALPVMKRRNEIITKRDKRLYIDTLHLSEDMFVNLDPKAKWMWDDAGQMAFTLLLHVRNLRSALRGSDQIDEKSVRNLPPDFDRNGQNSSKWWKVARRIFLRSYPEPQKIKEFRSLLSVNESKHSPGDQRQDILETLEKRFKGFAKSQMKQTVRECDCGKPATHTLSGEWVCERCFNLA